MNRRNFIRNLALGLSAGIFLPKIIKPTFKDTLKYGRNLIAVPNPAYMNAPYEVAFIGYIPFNNPEKLIPSIFRRDSNYLNDKPNIIKEEIPIRSNSIDFKNPIPPYIIKKESS